MKTLCKKKRKKKTKIFARDERDHFECQKSYVEYDDECESIIQIVKRIGEKSGNKISPIRLVYRVTLIKSFKNFKGVDEVNNIL